MTHHEDDDSLIPELVGGAVGLIPGGGLVQALGERASRAVMSEWKRNSSKVLALAVAQAGMSREDLADVLERKPSVVPLLVRTLYAAGMSGQDKTLRVLAGFLGTALADVSKVDDVSLMLSAIADLHEHHIKVLEILEQRSTDSPALRHVEAARWTTDLVVKASGMRRELTLAAVRGLLNAGFAADNGIDEDMTWDDLESGGALLAITDLGKTVLDTLRAVEDL